MGAGNHMNIRRHIVDWVMIIEGAYNKALQLKMRQHASQVTPVPSA
jgi:hypothetical protein